MDIKGFMIMVLAGLMVLSGCGQQTPKKMAPSTAQVAVVTLTAQSLPVSAEFPGRLQAVRVAQVRARAGGILLKRVFEEGSDVKEGQVLFQIDPASLQANLDSAQALLAKAQATLMQAMRHAKRFKSLLEAHAVSQQEYEDTQAALLQAEADVKAAEAAAKTARLNLGYATVTSPIDGRIGRALVTEGALVSQSNATELAVVTQLDPIYFDFTQSTADILKLKEAFYKGRWQEPGSAALKAHLILEDGSTYSLTGKLLFSDITVDPTTSMITLRAQFPNPDHVLLPGMFARIRLEQAISKAVMAPQRAVALGPNATATVMVVDADNKVEVRNIKIGSAVGNQWVVLEGLETGERVIVEGLQKAKPGSQVNVVVFKE